MRAHVLEQMPVVTTVEVVGEEMPLKSMGVVVVDDVVLGVVVLEVVVVIVVQVVHE